MGSCPDTDIRSENFANSPELLELVMTSFILMMLMFHERVILLRDFRCLSLLRIKCLITKIEIIWFVGQAFLSVN